MTYKLTIDSDLMNAKEKLPAVNLLVKWKGEGKLDLIETDPVKTADDPRNPKQGWPGAPPQKEEKTLPAWRGRRGAPKPGAGATIKFADVASVLFPGKNSQKLSMTDINQVARIIRHHTSKNEIFVTGAPDLFITGGRREHLKRVFGIIAMTAEETVKSLREMEGWE